MGRALFAGTLLGLCIGLMYAPQIGVAGPEQCPRGPNCTCFYPYQRMCLQQLRINNPKFVHLKVWVLGNINGSIWQIRQEGSGQIEGKDGEQTYIKRPRDSRVTSFSIQRCVNTFVGSTSCNGWQQANLKEPSVNDLEACETYADKAVAFYKQAKKLKCGYEDAFWTGDRKAHYNWCANLPDAERHFPDEHNKGRQQGLNDCQAKIAGAKAEAAEKAAEIAKNFTGTWEVQLSGVPYTFVLKQQGPAISGQLVNADPQLNGTIQGSLEADNQHVAFSYVQPQLNTGGHGRFWMELTKDQLGGRFFFNGQQAVRLLDGKRK
jgi:hypothetical protein